jgi:hypothetical protein
MGEWNFGKPSNPCKRGNTDVKTMMMMMMMISTDFSCIYHTLCFPYICTYTI